MARGKFASGRYAFFICDRCGMRHKYLTQIREVDTHLIVCRECEDEPLPQRRMRVYPDGEALPRPRPDVGPYEDG